MATNFQKAERHLKQDGEYKLLSYATSSESVEMADGSILQEKMDSVENDIIALKEDATPNNVVLYADDGEITEIPTINDDGTVVNVSIDSELSDTSTNPVQNKVITLRLNEVFQSVSNGKNLIASAIADMGVETDANATFEVMAKNIKQIESGGGGGSLLHNVLSFIPSEDNTGIYLYSPIQLAENIDMSHISISNDEVTLEGIEKLDDYSLKLVGNFYSHYDETVIKTSSGLFAVDCETVNNIDVYRRSMEYRTAGEHVVSLNGGQFYKINDGFAIGGYMYNPINNWFFIFLIAENQEDCNYRRSSDVNNAFESFVYDRNGKTYYYGTAWATQGDGYKIGGRALKINDIVPWQEAYAQGRDLISAMLDFYFGYI